MTAAPSTLPDLHRAIKARMAAIAACLPLLGTKAPEPAVDTDIPIARPAQIFEFDLPPKQLGQEQFPFLAVRPITCTDSIPGATQDATATFEIVVGTYSDTDDGGADVLLLMQAIRDSLAAEPRIEGTAFESVGPTVCNTENLGAVRPQWLGKVTTNWTLPRPRRVSTEA